MSIEAQRLGRQAEQRVLAVATKNGLNARLGSLSEDHAGKIDVVIEGIPFQVSCGRKSNGERKRLRKRGINPIVAGEKISEESVLASIVRVLGPH